MAEPVGRALLVSSDKVLAEAFTKGCQERGLEPERVASARESFDRWRAEGLSLVGVVADSLTLREAERRTLLEAHAAAQAPPLVMLEAPRPVQPAAASQAVARLSWPIPQSVLEELAALASGGARLVVLADNTLFWTGLLAGALQRAGLPAGEAQSLEELLQAFHPGAAGSEETPRPGVWSKLMGKGGKEVGAGGRPGFQAAVMLWRGDDLDAEELERKVRGRLPDARLVSVRCRESAYSAERSLKRRRPAFLPRAHAVTALDLISGRAAEPSGPGRVLLVDNFRPALAQLASSLLEDGYEVSACMRPEQALELASTDRFHMAVVGGSLTPNQQSGVELAQRLREFDPELRLILMVDRYPLQLALQGVSDIVEVGLDDCLLKPVEPSRLKFSISRALDRQRLTRENARLLEKLKAANQQLAQLTGFQSKFFAMVAHDVKNPLTAIQGYADMLSWKMNDAYLLQCVGHVRSSAKTLNGLISDLVDIAAIESGKLRVILQPTDLLAVVSDVRSRIQVPADARKIVFTVTVPDSLPELRGDALRIGQVIQNLCTNAIQYTPEAGSVTLTVEDRSTDILISVRDTGIGIARDDLPRIFERFFQAQNAQAMRKSGFGLGLKIAAEIIKGHGGGMGVDSELGKGSTFYFSLPVPVPGQGTAVPQAGEPAN